MLETTRFIYTFSEGSAEMKHILGGKGGNLAQMASLNLPVPAGFTITTQACIAYLEEGASFIDGIWHDIEVEMEGLEISSGKKFGDGDNPLLVSVRSGAPISMPGMMDTILNLGLNDQTVLALARLSGDSRFAYDCYRRFLQMFSNVVADIDGDIFETILETTRKKVRADYDFEIPAQELKKVVTKFKSIYKEHTGERFPSDVWIQLRRAVEAVFRSWNTPRAVTYRKINDIPDDLGTAVNVMEMVFGNIGDNSGTGVCFSRSPSDGEKKLFGEFLMNAQGEDVVAGIRTPLPISQMTDILPDIYMELQEIMEKLENHFHDMQDVEFTVEGGKLHILQTRTGKRSAKAAVKIAVDLAEEKMIDRATAISRISPSQIEQLLHRQIDPAATCKVLASGLPASPGAAVGSIVFDPDEAVRLGKEGEAVVLVRPETTPDDIHGLFAAQGILTCRGGMTSHAAVVARGLGKPCVSGAESVQINLEDKIVMVGDITLHQGEIITIDGSKGNVIMGDVPLIEPSFTEDFRKILNWADEISQLEVWVNADTPEDASRGREFGARGIGLCRTEHMFMAEDRLPVMEAMIIAETEEERHVALRKLKEMQEMDFRKIFLAMERLPVIIRLLDPPLHEFLPKLSDLNEYLHDLENSGRGRTRDADNIRKTIDKVYALRETNPMMGFRGCRLGIVYPEIYEMQVRAIFEAVVDLVKKGHEICPKIMFPLVEVKGEMKLLRSLVDRIARDYQDREKIHLEYQVGTMIELPRAALVADDLAETAEFFSFGTNDLTQSCFGYSRDDVEAKFMAIYLKKGVLAVNPFHELDREGVGMLMKIALEKGRKMKPNMSMGICGEHGGNPESVAFCHELGLNYVSCSPFRVPVARLSAALAQLGILK